MMNIDIYVDLQGGPLRLLRIPENEIVKFGSRRPHAFLRYSLFAICGRKGHLCFDVAGHRVPVDYNSQMIREKYIYVFDSSDQTHHAFIDLEGLNGRVISSVATIRRSKFRAEVERRDVTCVLSRRTAERCDAAHIVPHSKGDEYISKISTLRSHLYPEQEDIKEIDSITNALLLEAGLHACFGFGDYGLVRLPNFAMTCSDLPFNSTGFVPANRITLVQFVADDISSRPPPSTGLDARFTFGNKDIKLPSPMLQDFHFGVAFYKRWCIPGSEGAHYLGEFRKEHYENIPVRFTEYLDPGADDDLPVDGGPQDDLFYRPAKSVLGQKRMDQTMDQTMDNLVYLTMALQGLTPKVMADMEQRCQKEEQTKSRQKVLDWMEEASPPDSAESSHEITHNDP